MTDSKAGHCTHCGAGWREYTGCEKPDCEWKDADCEHKNLNSGFGLAGGGYGVYMYCTDCGFIVSKTQTD